MRAGSVLVVLLPRLLSCIALSLSPLDTLTSGLSSIVRIPVAAGQGTTVVPALAALPTASPPTALVLYEFEACPFCRKVREAVTVLDLDVLVKPCPRGSPFRAEARALGGKEQFPFLVDEDTGATMYESDDIIEYLVTSYGGGDSGPPAVTTVTVEDAREVIGGAVGLASGLLASGLRGFQGGRLSPSALVPPTDGGGGLVPSPRPLPQEPLELWSYENNQFCRPVREKLCELGLAYRVRSAGKGSPRRADLAALRPDGATGCPYLVDPNTGASLGESGDILAYLQARYARPALEPDEAAAAAAAAPVRARSPPGAPLPLPGFLLSPQARAAAAAGAEAARLKAEVVREAERVGGGVLDADEAGRGNAKLEALLAALEATGAGSPAPVREHPRLLSGTWALLWTTEAEVLFAMKQGLAGDGPCVGVTQTIDLAPGAPTGRLENRIDFAQGGWLRVDSSLTPDPADGAKFAFSFDACSLRWREAVTLPLPPVGKGTATVTYLDETFRVQRDSRGDTLVCVRKP